MINRFRQVTPFLFRGSAPSATDVLRLKNEFGINKIVSLDRLAGNRINRPCKILGIKHIMLPIDIDHLNESLINFLKHDIKDLLLSDGPTYVHCAEGKDRTGLAVALLQCKYFGKDPETAIEEAKSLGFGLRVDPKIIHTFEKLIRKCKPDKKTNDSNDGADIVSNEREYISDNRDSFLDEGHQGSFAPYLSQTRQNPQDALYNFVMDQSPTRENYESYKSIKEHNTQEDDAIPMVGIYNNDAGMYGAGPVFPAGGFISE
jgi:protein tyrosine/serine phosphatase